MSQPTLSEPPVTHGRPQTTPESAAAAPQIARQFVNFAFYRLDPEFRRLPNAEKHAARVEFVRVVSELPKGMMCLTYSTAGLKADCDIMLWRISPTPDDFQSQTAAMNRTRIGAYLSQPYSFLSMTKRSMYIDKLDPFHTVESRTHVIPGKRKYIFVYPFVKTRDWYLLPMEKRQEIMDGHIKVGNEFPSVKLNTTYSFGLDDQDFVVAFETEDVKLALTDGETGLIVPNGDVASLAARILYLLEHPAVYRTIGIRSCQRLGGGIL